MVMAQMYGSSMASWQICSLTSIKPQKKEFKSFVIGFGDRLSAKYCRSGKSFIIPVEGHRFGL